MRFALFFCPVAFAWSRLSINSSTFEQPQQFRAVQTESSTGFGLYHSTPLTGKLVLADATVPVAFGLGQPAVETFCDVTTFWPLSSAETTTDRTIAFVLSSYLVFCEWQRESHTNTYYDAGFIAQVIFDTAFLCNTGAWAGGTGLSFLGTPAYKLPIFAVGGDNTLGAAHMDGTSLFAILGTEVSMGGNGAPVYVELLDEMAVHCVLKSYAFSTASKVFFWVWQACSLLIFLYALFLIPKLKPRFGPVWFIVFIEGCLACPLRFYIIFGLPAYRSPVAQFAWSELEYFIFVGDLLSMMATWIVTFTWLGLVLNLQNQKKVMLQAVGYFVAVCSFFGGLVKPIELATYIDKLTTSSNLGVIGADLINIERDTRTIILTFNYVSM